MTWDGDLFIVILLALSLSYSLFSLTGSMPWTVTEWSQPSSAFSVRSKRRRVSFYFTRSLCSPVCTGCNLLLTYSVSLRQFSWHQDTIYRRLGECYRLNIDCICCRTDLAEWRVYALVQDHSKCVLELVVFFPFNYIFYKCLWLLSRLPTDQLKLIIVDLALWNSSQTAAFASEPSYNSFTWEYIIVYNLVFLFIWRIWIEKYTGCFNIVEFSHQFTSQMKDSNFTECEWCKQQPLTVGLNFTAILTILWRGNKKLTLQLLLFPTMISKLLD